MGIQKPSTPDQMNPSTHRYTSRWALPILLIVALLFGAVGLSAWVITGIFGNVQPVNNALSATTPEGAVSSYDVTRLPLSNLPFPAFLQGNIGSQLLINGQVQIRNGLVLLPTDTPASPQAGELYFSQSTNQPYYYDGKTFVSIKPITDGVSSIGSLTGNVALGAGLKISGGRLDTTLQASVNSITGTPNQVLVSATNGNVVLALPQDIDTSASPTFAGLHITGNLTAGSTTASSLTLGTSNSTTGSIAFHNLSNASVLTLQSGATASDIIFTLPTTDGNSGQCLSTNGSGVLAFQNCLTGSGSGGGVSSVDSLAGALTIANSTGAGGTITINDASTSQKGIAQFNGTNFSASGGTINTIQDIAMSSAPSFAALSITGSSGVTVGTSTMLGKLVLKDGNAATFGVTLQVQSPLTANQTLTMPDATGTLCLQAAASCGFAPASGSSNYIQNQISSQQNAANYWISGTGRADTSLLTPLLDTATSSSLNLGTTNATAINLNQNTAITAGKSLSFGAGTGSFDQSASTGTFATGSGSVSLNGNTTIAANKSLIANGAVTVADATNTTTAFQVQDASAATVLDVDTTNGRVGIGTASPNAKLAITDLGFSDTFNRADSSSLGSNWTKRTDAGSDFQIVSNQLKLTSSDNSSNALSAYTSQGISSADYSVQADIVFPSSSDDWLSVFGRGSTFGTNDSQGYYAFASIGNQKVALYKRVAGTFTQVGTSAFVTITAGTTYTIKLAMQGNTLSLYWNGQLATTATDSTFSSAGFAGVALGQPNLVNSIWDNFSITPFTPTLNINNSLVVTANGQIGVGTTSPSYAIDVQGGNSINTTGSYLLNGVSINTAGTLNNVAYLMQANTFTQANTFSTSILTPLIDTASAVPLNIGTTNANAINLNQNTAIANNKSFTAFGPTLFKDATNSTTAFQVQNSSGASLFTTDTTNGTIVLGNDGTPAALTVRGGAATGTNVAGSTITFDASNGTGTGGSGDFVFRTAPVATTLPTFDTATTNSPGSVSSTSWTHVVANQTNRLLMVSIIERAADSVAANGVTYNGANLTLLDTQACPTTNFSVGCKLEIWYMVAPAVGSHSIAVTFNGTATSNEGAVSYYGVNQTTPLGTDTKSSGTTSGTTPVSITTASNTNQLVFDSIAADNPLSTPTARQRWLLTSPSRNQTGGQDTPGLSPNTTTGWNVNTGDWAEIGVPINQPTSTIADGFIDRLHITASGNVGINNAAPGSTLDVSGSARVVSTTNSTTAFQVQNASNSNILTVDTANMVVTVSALTVTGNITVGGHVITSGSAPTIAAGAAACTSPTVSIAGNDSSGSITVTTGTGCSTGGKLATITFHTVFGVAPRVTLTPANVNSTNFLVYIDSGTISTTAFDVDTAPSAAITNGTTYKWYYGVQQ